MGSVLYKRITNVYEIPNDIVVDCIGPGLLAARDRQVPCLLVVYAGSGLGFDNDSRLIVATGAGITTDSDGNVIVDIGTGLTFDDQGRLAVSAPAKPNAGLSVDENGLDVNVGDGLHINSDNDVEVLLSPENSGLVFDQGCLAIDTELSSDNPSDQMTLVTDLNLSLDGHWVILQKTFTNFQIKRNKAGILLDIIKGESRTEKDEIMITDYGYSGYGASYRIGTPESPNFYDKK